MALPDNTESTGKTSMKTALLAATAALLMAGASQAAKLPTQFCQFNGGQWLEAETIDRGSTFTLLWSDGPRQTYRWVGSNADRHNITDSLGGRWQYWDHRTRGGMTLTNLDNGNKIICLATTARR